ncbi:MAG TPA: hypothetical protein VGS19_31450 [Streptosporangiaceae bacterium]|nr:hypothetical protein [Streptosporangiaceae bacterium]
MTVSGPAALAASAAGRHLPRGAGSGAVMFEQADGRRYTVPAAAAPHARWQPATGVRAARPGQAQATLRLKVTDLAGMPASDVQVVLMNTDNAALDPAPVSVTGTGRASVVPGDYSLFAFFTDYSANGNPVAFHCVFRDDFRVGAAGTTVTIPESSATSPVSVATPRRAAGITLETVFFRGSKVNGGTATGLIIGPPDMLPVYISPQPTAQVGQLRYLSRWSGASFSGRYAYDTAFAFPDIPRGERFVVRQSQLATIHEHFYADAVFPGQGTWSDDPCDAALLCGGYSNAAQRVPFFPVHGVDMPGNLTDYLDTSSGDQWMSSVFMPDQAFLIGDPQTFLAGHSYSVDWAHGPLAAGLGQHTGPWQCQACTAGRTLSLNFSSLGDSDPSHFVLPVQDQRLQPRTRFTLYRDGSELASLSNASGDVVQVPPGTATYRAVLNVNMTHHAGVYQSSQSHTVLTVRYAPGTESALPAEDICAGQAAATPCRILPVLTLGYQLATNEANASNLATQVLHLQVGHLSYDGIGSHAAITSAAVWVSFNSGKSWQRAKVTGTGGQYTATWPNPALQALTSPDIKVAASDAIGGSITQTITRAYTIVSIAHRARG